MEVYRIAELRRAVAHLETVIEDTPTNVISTTVLHALKNYDRCLARRERKLKGAIVFESLRYRDRGE